MRPTVSVRVGWGRRVGRVRWARPIQLFEGSRPWGGIYANSNGVGVRRRAWEIGGRVSKSAGRIGPVVVCVGLGRKFEARLEVVSGFGGQKSAPRWQVVRRTE
jgi:hypothetical protein